MRSSEWPMHRFAYRSFPDHEALVGNFTVGGGRGVPAPRSAGSSFATPGSGWTLFQEGTQDPGEATTGSWAASRWTSRQYRARLLGLEQHDVPEHPLRDPHAGQSARDPEAEQTLAGIGSQTRPRPLGRLQRDGVDPATECTFWYTNEYYQTMSENDWKTAVGRIPCTKTKGN